METQFVTISSKPLHRSRRSRRHKKSNPTVNTVNILNTQEHKQKAIEQQAKAITPIKSKKTWKKPIVKESMICIQQKQLTERILQTQIRYKSTTNRTFLLSLTLSKIKSDPSLIVCASYICRICQQLKLYVASDIIILCHQFYQFSSFAKYIYIKTPSLCTFLSNNNQTFNCKTQQLLTPSNHCIATNIHLKYTNLINIIDKNDTFIEWNNLKTIFRINTQCYFLRTYITLFDENGKTLCDDALTLKANALHSDLFSSSLLYDSKYGLLSQITNENGNIGLFQLIEDNSKDKEEYIWKELMILDGIWSKSLMCIFKENIFICNDDIVCLYDLENNVWNELEGMYSINSNIMKQLYFDATSQQMFLMGIDAMDELRYTFDELQNKWVECNYSVSFNYYDIIKNHWYHHPSIFSNYNGSIDSLLWMEDNDPSVKYCTLLSWNKYNRKYECNVQYYDNRSRYKQWYFDPYKTASVSNMIDIHMKNIMGESLSSMGIVYND